MQASCIHYQSIAELFDSASVTFFSTFGVFATIVCVCVFHPLRSTRYLQQVRLILLRLEKK